VGFHPEHGQYEGDRPLDSESRMGAIPKAWGPWRSFDGPPGEKHRGDPVETMVVRGLEDE